jgi:hypothetical protein
VTAILVGLLAWLLVGAVVGARLGRVIHGLDPGDERWPGPTAADPADHALGRLAGRGHRRSIGTPRDRRARRGPRAGRVR